MTGPVAAPKAKGFGSRLVDYALGQARKNPVVVLDLAANVAAAVIAKLPLSAGAKGTVRGVLGALLTVAKRDAVTPAPAAQSAVQKALARSRQ